MRGDLVATMPSTSGATTISSYAEADEFGNSATNAPSRYGWLAKYERSSDALARLVLMGDRLYNPNTAMFLSPDSQDGGNATNYGYPQDPVNSEDPSGCSCRKGQYWSSRPLSEWYWWGDWYSGSKGLFDALDIIRRVKDWFDWEVLSVSYEVTSYRHRFDHKVQIFETCEDGIRYTVMHVERYYQGQGYIHVYVTSLHFFKKQIWSGWVTDWTANGMWWDSKDTRWRWSAS
jgi:RHS repeat-associated protein